MPFKLSMGGSTESYLCDPSLIPSHGGRYKVITNASVLSTVRQELATAGLIVDRELFSSNGNVSVGNHYISYGTDENVGIVFTWVNSYDKSTRFHCSIGLHFKDNDGVMMTSDMAFFMRKHTGTADVEMVDAVKNQVARVSDFYNELMTRKSNLQLLTVSRDEMGDIIGRAFINDYLKADQLTATKHYYESLKKDEITYWEAYFTLASSIKHSHPKFYTRSHIGCFDTVYAAYLHRAIISTPPSVISALAAGLSTPPQDLSTPVDPAQINIFDVIAEEEELHVDMTNDLLVLGLDYDEPSVHHPVDTKIEPEVFDFEEEEVPFDTTPVPNSFYEDQEKVENTLSTEDEFFNFGDESFDLPEL